MAKKKPPELKDDPELLEAQRRDMLALQAAQAQGLSIADRLTKTVFEQTFTIEWPSVDGPIPIKFRIPTLKEMDRFAFLMAEVPRIATGPDRTGFEALFREFRRMIADFCQEPSMPLQWWEEGKFPFAYLYQIASEIVYESGRRIAEVEPFRLRSGRTETMDPLQPDGKETTRAL